MQTGSTEGSSRSPLSSGGFDFAWLANRAKEVIIRPVDTWPIIKREQHSVGDIYTKYVIPFVGACAIAGFIGMALVGVPVPFMGSVRQPFFQTLIFQVVTFGLQLGALYVMALIVQKVAGMCEGNASVEDSLKLLAYSYTPGYIAGLLGVFPAIMMIGALFSLYSIYVFWVGIPIMTTVSPDRRFKFIGLLILAGIALSIVMMIVTRMFMPMAVPSGF